MPKFKVSLAALAVMASTSLPAVAEGLTLRLEGGLSFASGEDVGIFSLGKTPPATPTSRLHIEKGMDRGPLSFAYRAEATQVFDLGDGAMWRIGGVLSGTDGSQTDNSRLYYVVAARPGGPEPGGIEGEIRVCPYPDPCVQFEGELDRSYHEVMPELMFGRTRGDGSTLWFGVQGFVGTLEESTSNRATALNISQPLDRTTTTDMDGDATGLLVAVQHERPLASGAMLLLGGGLGPYRIEATGLSVDPAVPLSAKPVSGSFDGVRAQLSVGIDYPLRDNLTLGAIARADYWSDQPRIKADWSAAPCTPLLCEPPRARGNFNLSSDPYLSLSVGVALTWRM